MLPGLAVAMQEVFFMVRNLRDFSSQAEASIAKSIGHLHSMYPPLCMCMLQCDYATLVSPGGFDRRDSNRINHRGRSRLDPSLITGCASQHEFQSRSKRSVVQVQ